MALCGWLGSTIKSKNGARCKAPAGKETVPLGMLENDTRNQHFLTRVEQKLNAMNPQAGARKLRIYSFEVVNRENHTLANARTAG